MPELYLPDAPRGNVMLVWKCPSCNMRGPGVFIMSVTFHYKSSGSPCMECLGCHLCITLGQLFQQLTSFLDYVPIVSDAGQRSAGTT